MDYKALLRHLNKYKWFIIIIPIITVVITRYMVKDLPKQFVSQALIATGFADQSKQVSAIQSLDFFKTGQEFTNIIEKIKLKKVISMLSYSLIIHDLEHSNSRFKKPSKKLDSLSTDQKQEVLVQFKDMLAKHVTLAPADDQMVKLYQIVASMGYDDDYLNKSLQVTHADGSDFIAVTYTSDNPRLSAFVVNTLCEQFIANYNEDIEINQNNSIALLDSLLKRKELVKDQKTDSLRKFISASGVLNLDKQSETAYADLSAAQARKDVTLRQIKSDEGAISAIEGKLSGNDPFVNNDNIVDNNKEIVSLKNKITVAYNIKADNNNSNPADQKRIDSLQTLLSVKLKKSTTDNPVDVVLPRNNLIAERERLSTELAQAKSGLPALDHEINELSARYAHMVPYDANIQNYQREADQAVKDYTDAFNLYNKTKTEQSIGTKVNIAQEGLVDAPAPSKQMILIALSGAGSFVLCLVVVIALFFLDHSVKTPKQLVLATGLPVMGSLNLIKIGNEPIKNIWHDERNASYVIFKNLLRSIRLDITSQMQIDNSKILGITSLCPGEGRSFIASCLAYAFAMTGKQVLLIGAETQLIENSLGAPQLREKFEHFLEKKEIHVEHLITTLNKNDRNTSLLELQNTASVRAGFEVLRKEFDIIIIDINSLKDMNVAKEWLLFTDKNIAIFNAGKEMSERDKDMLVHLRDNPGFMGWIMNKVRIDRSVA